MGYDPSTVVDHGLASFPVNTEQRLCGVLEILHHTCTMGLRKLFDAILHHGGEAEEVVTAFMNLTVDEQNDVLVFTKTVTSTQTVH